jgi:Helix-turn-helix domain/RodZ C-terminal domain
VFEIGNSLREARLRQGLEIPRVEGETKIRGKYLRALEEEQFEVLPGDTYVKGFLRTYADYLGLDGQLYLDEYNSRFAASEEISFAQSPAPKRRRRRVESNLVVVALAAIVAVTVLLVVGLSGLGGSGGETPPPATMPTTPTATAPTSTTAGEQGAAGSPPIRFVLTAVDGGSYVQVRAGGVNGRLVWEGTLEQGQTQRFTKYSRLWLDLDAPGNLTAKVNDRTVKNLPTRPAVVLVTAKGVRTISTGP